MTLDLAGAKGLIEVAELKDSEVNRLRLRSRAKEPVFVMAGEMVRGGKQDRIVADDLLLAPGDELTVAVFCVEHGRWVAGGGGGRFTTGHSLAGAGARGAARAAAVRPRCGPPLPSSSAPSGPQPHWCAAAPCMTASPCASRSRPTSGPSGISRRTIRRRAAW